MRRRLNKKRIGEIRQMLDSAIAWHRIYHCQDDQDLEPEMQRRELQRRARWKKSRTYFEALISEHQTNSKKGTKR